MITKVVLFTANVQGGILQLTLQLYKTLKEEGYDAKVIMPYEIKGIDISPISESDLLQYHKEKKIIDKTPYKELATRINTAQPDFVWYMDDSVICSNVGLFLHRNIRQLLTLHDAGTHHPANHRSVRSVLVEKYTSFINKQFYRRVDRFILLSPESVKTFSRLYPTYKGRTVMMTLGAHLPEVEEMQPAEMSDEKDYLLFFGRIDKYKGIGNLLNAYRNVSDRALLLVIAGGGQFSDEEKELIRACDNLTVINRYIGDGEMKWLFHHMTAAVLPYIEATQSGIIPLAYLFGKPVIVSNVAGLTQFVEDGETGLICKTPSELEEALVKLSLGVGQEQTKKIKQYYDGNMNWNANVRGLFASL